MINEIYFNFAPVFMSGGLYSKKHIMTISDSLPVQFWVNGELTYNETDICGVEVPCFCQQFECDDEINIQFTAHANNEYVLVFYDKNGAELDERSFSEVSSGVYYYSFRFTDLFGVDCSDVYQLKIANAILEDPGFDGPGAPLTPWENSGAGVSWSKVSNAAFVDLSGSASSKILRQEIFLNEGNYVLNFNYTVGGVYWVDIFLSYTGPSTLLTKIIDNATGSGWHSVLFTIGAGLAGTYYLGLYAEGAGATVTLSVDNVQITRLVFYNSDCIDVKESHNCTALINYTNATDFDGIVYDTSPQPDFNIRIPAQFWKQDNPMEQEDSELSNGVIKTRRQTISEKQLLEVGYMPNYMHKKLQKILMHDTITIDGDQWKKRDAYESENVRRYALKRANVWLTKYNSIEDNIL